jgi:small subunit ribosomal protein S11
MTPDFKNVPYIKTPKKIDKLKGEKKDIHKAPHDIQIEKKQPKIFWHDRRIALLSRFERNLLLEGKKLRPKRKKKNKDTSTENPNHINSTIRWRWIKQREKLIFTRNFKNFSMQVKKTKFLKKWIRRFLLGIYFKRFLKVSKITRVYIISTYRNIIITISDSQGHVLHRVSAGSTKGASFKKAVRKKPFPATSAGKEVAAWLKNHKLRKLIVFLKGVGRGKSRKYVLKALEKQKLIIYGITDLTSIPHNGCKKPKKRRL